MKPQPIWSSARWPPDSFLAWVSASGSQRGELDHPLGLRLAIDVRRATARIEGGQQVLAHRQAAEQPRHLERAHQPAPRDLVHREAADALAGELHLAGVGRVDAGDEIDQRGLAGAVGTDQAADLARARR